MLDVEIELERMDSRKEKKGGKKENKAQMRAGSRMQDRKAGKEYPSSIQAGQMESHRDIYIRRLAYIRSLARYFFPNFPQPKK